MLVTECVTWARCHTASMRYKSFIHSFVQNPARWVAWLWATLPWCSLASIWGPLCDKCSQTLSVRLLLFLIHYTEHRGGHGSETIAKNRTTTPGCETTVASFAQRYDLTCTQCTLTCTHTCTKQFTFPRMYRAYGHCCSCTFSGAAVRCTLTYKTYSATHIHNTILEYNHLFVISYTTCTL